jgi:transcriptional regulator with XRE-family HTH domain
MEPNTDNEHEPGFLDWSAPYAEHADRLAMCHAVAVQVRGFLRREGKTQAWLAQKLGVSQAQVSKLFSGENLTLDTIARLARVIGFIPALEIDAIPQERQTPMEAPMVTVRKIKSVNFHTTIIAARPGTSVQVIDIKPVPMGARARPVWARKIAPSVQPTEYPYSYSEQKNG